MLGFKYFLVGVVFSLSTQIFSTDSEVDEEHNNRPYSECVKNVLSTCSIGAKKILLVVIPFALFAAVAASGFWDRNRFQTTFCDDDMVGLGFPAGCADGYYDEHPIWGL